MAEKRKVEVFVAGGPLCDETVSLVNELSCSSCDVTVYNLNESGMDKAREYGVTCVPTVVVNGTTLDCCKRGKPTADDLRAAGIGTSLGKARGAPVPPPVLAPEDAVNSHDAGKEVQLKGQQPHREKTYTENAGMLGKEMPTGVCYYTCRQTRNRHAE